MKIRMRNNPEVIEDQVYPEHGPEYGWSKRGMRDGMKIFFTTADWEPIPTEQWRDVTGECELHGGHLVHKTIGVRAMGETGEILVHVQSVDGYRLRKVQLSSIFWLEEFGKEVPKTITPQWAFLVERRVNEKD